MSRVAGIGTEAFATVISRGTAYQREHPTTSIEGAIQLNLARAYGDMVFVADGGTYREGEATATTLDREGARLSAIAAYRAALATPHVESAQSLAELWRLQASLAPIRSWFYCVYD